MVKSIQDLFSSIEAHRNKLALASSKKPVYGSSDAPTGVPCELCKQEGFTVLPATSWNTTDEKPVPVCPMHVNEKRSVSWAQGLRMFLVWKVNNE